MSDIRLVSAGDVRELRISVFSHEMGYPEDKLFDEHENTAGFLAFFMDGRAVGCGRFYEKQEKIRHIDNIAFKDEMRGKGFGREFVLALVDECKKHGAERVTVNALSHAVGFYEKCGFTVCGNEFEDENFKRVPMICN